MVEELGHEGKSEVAHSFTCFVDSREEKKCEIEIKTEISAWDNKIIIITFSNQTSNTNDSS